MNILKDKNILLCVTGSIAAYKACEILRLLKKDGANVQVMMSKSAEEFIGVATFAALSNLNPAFIISCFMLFLIS